MKKFTTYFIFLLIMVGNARKCFISIACPFALECAIRSGSVCTIKKSAEALEVASYGDWSRSKC